jgi:hypothetical protein
VEKTRRAAEQQIAAMGASVYEVGLYNPEAERAGQPVMLPRTWDVAGLLRSISWLRLQNSTGRNIYVRPRGEHNLSLVDDLAAAAVERMKAAGFAPALVVETSPGNFQAWLKHPCPLRKELSTAVARRLAAEFGGDSGAADWRHFGRLVGFTNRKETRRQPNGMFPFVRLIEASGREYAAGNNFVARVEDELRQATAQRQRERSAPPKYRVRAPTKSIDSFRSNPIYGGDGTRIDLAYSIYALSHGCSTAEVDAALRSRNLDHKGTEKRQLEYVERTILKATKLLGERGLVRGRAR